MIVNVVKKNNMTNSVSIGKYEIEKIYRDARWNLNQLIISSFRFEYLIFNSDSWLIFFEIFWFDVDIRK